MKLKEIRKSEAGLIHLIVVLPIVLLITFGIYFVFLIIAWGNFGEGANSKLYSHWTSLAIYTFTFLVVEVIVYQWAKIQINKRHLKKVKALYYTGILIMLLYLLMLYFLYF